MNALSIANYIVNNWSDKIEITNLKLNKLVYYSYVESLRKLGRPLFDDAIEAWQYGPVEPAVYQAFSSYGRNPIGADRSLRNGKARKPVCVRLSNVVS